MTGLEPVSKEWKSPTLANCATLANLLAPPTSTDLAPSTVTVSNASVTPRGCEKSEGL